MKLSLISLMIAALAFALGNSALALHDADTLKCMACHTMHASENGSNAGITVDNGFDAVGATPPSAGATPPPAGGIPHLLVQANVTDLCLACHYEGSSFTDSNDVSPPAVFTIDGTQDIALPGGDYSTSDVDNGAQSHNPGRQQYNAVGDVYSDSIPEDTTLYMTPPGGDADVNRWDCVACHAPHYGDSGGSTGTYGQASSFRMLWSNPDGKGGSGVTFTAEAGDTSSDEADDNHTAYQGNVSSWCGICHGDFHNHVKSGGWLLHPSGFGIIKFLSEYRTDGYSFLVPIEDPDATTDGTPFTITGSSEVMCLTCHRSHATATGAEDLTNYNGESDLINNTNNMTRWDMQEPSGAGRGCNKCHAKGQ